MDQFLSRLRAFFSTLTAPEQIKTNRDTDFLRLLACLCMVIDHAGKMFFPQLDWMRLVGRTAFPLFAYGIAVGAAKTHNPLGYLSRIAALALISQPLYAVALAHENAAMYTHSFLENPLLAVHSFYINSWKKPSILLTLFLGLCLLLSLRRRLYAGSLLLGVLCWRFSDTLDYGFYGVLLMVLFYITLEHPVLSLAPLALFFLSWAVQPYGSYPLLGLSFTMRLFALPAILLTRLPMKRRLRLPVWFSYGFYPAHLAVIALLVHLPA